MAGHHRVSRFIEGEESNTPPQFIECSRPKQRAATEYSALQGVCPPPPPPPPPSAPALSGTWPAAASASSSSPPQGDSRRRYRADSSSSECDSFSSSWDGHSHISQEEMPCHEAVLPASADSLEDTYVFDPTIYDKDDDEVYNYDENGHRIHHHHHHRHDSGPEEGHRRVSKAERLKALFHRGREVVDVWKQPESTEERLRRDARVQARAARYENYGC